LELPFFIHRLLPESYAAGLLACSVLIKAFPSRVLGTVASGVIKNLIELTATGIALFSTGFPFNRLRTVCKGKNTFFFYFVAAIKK